jgi:hypothetical protein
MTTRRALAKKQLNALLYIATGNMSPAKTIDAAMAQLDKLLAGRGVHLHDEAASAILLQAGDGKLTAEEAWAALLALAPPHEAPAVPPTPVIANGHTAEEAAAIEAALAAKPATVIPPKAPKEPKPAAASKPARTAGKGKAQPKPAQAPAAAQDAAKPAQADAQRYRLPAPGTKYRLALDLLRQPNGATNKELNAETGLQGSWAAQARAWAERYGLTYARTEEKAGGHVQARLSLTGSIPGEEPRTGQAGETGDAA